MNENPNYSFPNAITKLCVEKFSNLPKNGKPVEGKQWTVLAAVIKEDKLNVDNPLKVVSLATGTTCVGETFMKEDGKILHDSHAEVLARRAFIRYLLHEVTVSTKKFANSIFDFRVEQNNKLFLKPEISFHFYTSQSPCGDAAIFPQHKILSKDLINCHLAKNSDRSCSLEDPPRKKRCKSPTCETVLDLHRTGAKPPSQGIQDKLGEGLAYHEVGLLRVKPGRGERTCSMSCSDKMLKWNIMGCQGALMTLLLADPIYFQSVTIGQSNSSLIALKRALFLRVTETRLLDELHGTKFSLHRPSVFISDVKFPFYKQSNQTDIKPCGSSLVWCDVSDRPLQVVAKSGYLLGTTRKTEGLSQSVCAVSRSALSAKCKCALDLLPKDQVTNVLTSNPNATYSTLKSLADLYSLTWKSVTKNILKTWMHHNEKLDLFSI